MLSHFFLFLLGFANAEDRPDGIQGVPNCYYRDGTFAYGYTPCTANTTSLCCPDGFDCRAGGLCSSPQSYIYDGSAQEQMYGIDFIDVANQVACTDKNWSCKGPPDACSAPFDTDCYPDSTSYIPLKGCNAEVEAAIDKKLWLRCNCADESCAGAQKKYESFSTLGDVICPANRQGQPFGTYCGSSVVNIPFPSATTIAQTTLRTISTIDTTVHLTATALALPQENAREERIISKTIALSVVFGLALIGVAICLFMLHYRKARTKTTEKEEPPAYTEAIGPKLAMIASSHSSESIKDPSKKQPLGGLEKLETDEQELSKKN